MTQQPQYYAAYRGAYNGRWRCRLFYKQTNMLDYRREFHRRWTVHSNLLYGDLMFYKLHMHDLHNEIGNLRDGIRKLSN